MGGAAIALCEGARFTFNFDTFTIGATGPFVFDVTQGWRRLGAVLSSIPTSAETSVGANLLVKPAVSAIFAGFRRADGIFVLERVVPFFVVLVVSDRYDGEQYDGQHQAG